jgi:hypothetical protein
MILDEKVLSPLSSYTKAPATSAWRTFSALPPHLLLQIVYATFSDAYDVEEQRKTLYWLSTGLRLVNRSFYSSKPFRISGGQKQEVLRDTVNRAPVYD